MGDGGPCEIPPLVSSALQGRQMSISTLAASDLKVPKFDVLGGVSCSPSWKQSFCRSVSRCNVVVPSHREQEKQHKDQDKQSTKSKYVQNNVQG